MWHSHHHKKQSVYRRNQNTEDKLICLALSIKNEFQEKEKVGKKLKYGKVAFSQIAECRDKWTSAQPDQKFSQSKNKSLMVA